jgi:hypothetical protein
MCFDVLFVNICKSLHNRSLLSGRRNRSTSAAVDSSSRQSQQNSLTLSTSIGSALYETVKPVPINTVGVHHIRLRHATGRAHGSSTSQLRTPQRQRGGSGTAGNIFSALIANNSSNTADSDSVSTDPYAPAPWIVLVAEVALAGDGALRVTVRSRLSITNHSGVPLELCLYSPVPSSYSNTANNTSSSPTSPTINTNSGTNSGSAISSPPLPLRQDTVLAAGACMHVPLALITPQLKVLSRPVDGSVKWGPVVQSLRDIDTRAARSKHRDADNVFAVCAPDGRGGYNSSSSSTSRGTQSSTQQLVAAADWCLHGEIVCERSSSSGTDNRCATDDDYSGDANDEMSTDGTGTDTAAYSKSGESPASERSSSSPATAASMLRQAKGAFSDFADLFDISTVTSPPKAVVPLAAPTVSPLFTVPEQSIEPGYPTEDTATVSTSSSTALQQQQQQQQQQRQRASDYAAHDTAPNSGDELNTATTSTTASGATTTTASTAAAWQSVQVPQTRGSRCFRLQRGQTGGRGTSDGFVDVPDTDAEVLQQGLKSIFAVDNSGSSSSTDWTGIDKLRLMQQSGSSAAATGLQPLAITLQAPLQLHNLLCQPLAYRLVSR